MKVFLTFSILLLILISSGQANLNVWDFISTPHGGTHPDQIWPVTNRQDAEHNIRLIMPSWIREELSGFFTMKLVKIALLNARPHANSATNSLFLATIPADISIEPELRYFAAFKREAQLEYQNLLDEAFSKVSPEGFGWNQKQMVFTWTVHSHLRCDAIVDLMARLESITSLATLASNPDFVRNSMLVSIDLVDSLYGFKHILQPLTGVEIQSSTNPISLKIGAITQRLTYPSSTTLAMRQFHRLGNVGPATQVNQSDGATITSKNGPNLITVGTTSTVLAKDASRVLTFADLGQGVKSVPIDLPVATRSLPDISIEKDVVQSVNLDGLFSGIRTTIAATTSDSSKVTVAKSRSGGSMGVTGLAVGSAVVNVSATNEAGTTTVSFTVTVTAGEE